MGNTFGTPIQQFPIIESCCIREHRDRFRRDALKDLQYANSYYSMSGRWPDKGWILIDRNSYNKIRNIGNGIYANNLQLNFQDFVNPTLTISNLSIVQARCVTRGLATDNNAIYLVQLTNNQGVLYSPWFQYPVNAQYNVRVPSYESQYYTWSLNSGSTWTWDTMLNDLWSRTTLLGTYPHLPSTPTGTPENFILVGVPLWSSITRILEYLGMSVVNDYPNFSIVTSGASDASFTALQSKYAKYLEDDMEYIDGGSGRVPSQMVVYFHRRNQYYGTEETVRNDQFNWQATPSYSITVSSPATFTNSAGVGHLWSDFTVRYDQDGNPLAADVTTASTIAQERAIQFYNNIFRGTTGFMRQVYSGVLPFTTGSLVDGVRWYNGTSGNGEPYGGWRTEIIRGYSWEEATFPSILDTILDNE